MQALSLDIGGGRLEMKWRHTRKGIIEGDIIELAI